MGCVRSTRAKGRPEARSRLPVRGWTLAGFFCHFYIPGARSSQGLRIAALFGGYVRLLDPHLPCPFPGASGPYPGVCASPFVSASENISWALLPGGFGEGGRLVLLLTAPDVGEQGGCALLLKLCRK